MKLFIASDIHGDLSSARAVVEAFKKSGLDKLVILGDILYHGPRNDLPGGYNPKGVIELLNSVCDSILAVRGNCEAEVDDMVLAFPVLADYAYICDGNVGIFATHGHKFNIENPPKLKRGEVLLCGHTHIPAFKKFGNENLYVNPGSVSIPKENSKKSYIIYEDRKFTLYDLAGNKIMQYAL